LKSPTKKELLITTFFVASILALIGLAQSATFGPTTMSSNTNVTPTPGLASSSSPENVLHSIFNTAPNPSSSLQISQGVVGEVKLGYFQKMSFQLLALITKFGGYTEQSYLSFSNGLWNGNWLFNIPSKNATRVLFNMSTLIDSNGKVERIQVNQQFVNSSSTAGNTTSFSSVEWSPLTVNLQETDQLNPPPFYAGAVAILRSIGAGVVYYGILGVPVYLGILALIFVTRRGLIPLIFWMSRVSRPKTNGAGLAGNPAIQEEVT
jgi:hypothetical protein